MAFTTRLIEAGVDPSVGSVGDALDNALAETTVGRSRTPRRQGSEEVAEAFVRRARDARVALIDWNIGLASTPDVRVGMVFTFDIVDDRIVRISLVAAPERIDDFHIALLDTN